MIYQICFRIQSHSANYDVTKLGCSLRAPHTQSCKIFWCDFSRVKKAATSSFPIHRV